MEIMQLTGLVIALACALMAGFIANGKNRSAIIWGGFGFFFGPLGLLAVIAAKRREKPMKEAQVILNASAHGGYTSASKAAQALRETKQ